MIDHRTRAIEQLSAAIAEAEATGAKVTMTTDVKTAAVFLSTLEAMAPDMPPLPICAALGPLVGDFMTNARLARLDEAIERIDGVGMRLLGVSVGLEIDKREGRK